jgi:hypothetical protein
MIKTTKAGWVAEAKAKNTAAASAACFQGLLASMLVGVAVHENRLGTAASSRAIKPVKAEPKAE